MFFDSLPLGLSLLWEAPWALGSWIFYRVMRAVINRFYIRYLSRQTRLQWRVLSADTLKIPIALPVLMTTGPRWNTHAVIGTLGPFEVEQTLAIDIATIQRSARSWVAVVYDFPSYATIQSLDSQDFDGGAQSNAEPNDRGKQEGEQNWVKISLPPGRYTLGVRYYDCAEAIAYPPVQFDDQPPLPPHSADPKTNLFYQQLKDYPHRGFYLCLHYYTYVMLKYRDRLPEAWVRQEYLPVGAPDTTFFYGGINRKQTLHIELAPTLLDQFDFYFNLYDWASFPSAWTQLSERTTTYFAEANGSFLFRVRPRRGTPVGVWPEYQSTIAQDGSIQVRWSAMA